MSMAVDETHSRAPEGAHLIAIRPYGHHWYRVGAPDNTLNRIDF